MRLAAEDPFHLEQNASGCINLGAAENELMVAELQQRIQDSKCWQVTAAEMKYSDMLGTVKTRQALATFLNHHLHVAEAMTLQADDVSIHNGCGSAVESLFHVLCDEGDAVLIPSPYYGGFDMDLERRARIQIVPVVTRSSNGFSVSESALEEAYTTAQAQGKAVKALLIVNPINPLGIVYSPNTILLMADFCHRHQIHFVVDEIYAFSVFHTEADPHWIDGPHLPSKFQSAYSHSFLPDVQRTHVLWGFSKDFCVNGFRAGVCLTKNALVRRGLNELAYFTAVPSVIQKILVSFVSDQQWCSRFFALNKERLRSAYTYVVGRLLDYNEEFGRRFPNLLKPQDTGLKAFPIRYLPACAGFFLWVDFSYFLAEGGEQDIVQQEKQLFLQLIHPGGLYIAPGGIAFHAIEPGWFRIIFAAPEAVLALAMDRLLAVLDRFASKKAG